MIWKYFTRNSFILKDLELVTPKSLSLKDQDQGGPTTATHKRKFRSRSEFVITDTELKLIAALASIGLSSHPKIG